MRGTYRQDQRQVDTGIQSDREKSNMRRTNGYVYIEDKCVTYSSRTYKQSVLLGKRRLMHSLCSPTNGDKASIDIVVFRYKISKTRR